MARAARADASGPGRAGAPDQTPKITRVPVEGITSFAGSSW
jgi:hypothetical protein